MNSMLNDAIDTTKNAAETVKDGTQQAAVSTWSTLLEGARVVSGVVATVRNLGLNDALGWVGLERRRSPLVSIATFGAGFAAGAGAALFLAPMSGADFRKMIGQRLMGLEKDVEKKADEIVETAKSSDLAQKAGDIADKAGDVANNVASTAKKVENKVEKQVVAGAQSVASAAKNVGDAVKEGFGDLSHATAGAGTTGSQPGGFGTTQNRDNNNTTNNNGKQGTHRPS